MVAKNLDNLLSEVLALPPDERAKVLATITHVDGVPENVLTGAADDAVKEVWPFFVSSLSVNGVRMPHVGIVSRHRAYPRLVDGCQHLLDFIVKFDPKGPLERRAAIEFCVKAVIAYAMKYVPAAIGPKVIADTLPRVGAAIDRQFPGYQASGLLRVLIKKRGTKLAAR